MKSKKIYSSLILLLAAMIWGFAFAAQDDASDIPAFTLGALRGVLAGFFLIIVITVYDRVSGSKRRLFTKRGVDLTRTELIGGAIAGCVLTAASALQQIGINEGTDGGKAGFITALYVILVPIFALFLKKRSPFNVWIGVFISIIGFYLLCIKDGFTVAASDLYVFGGAVMFTFHILTIDRFAPRCDGIRMSCVQFFVYALLNCVLAILFDAPTDISIITDNLFSIIFLGIGSSGIAYTLQIVGQKDANPTVATIILSLESVFGVIGTALFLSQTLTPREYLGCAIIFVAVILAQLDLGAIFKMKE